MNCPIHNVPFENKTSKLGKPYMGHFVQGAGMCFPPNNFTPRAEGSVLRDEGSVLATKAAEPVREPLKETNWDEIARGKIRSLFIEAKISRDGLVPLSNAELFTLDALVEVAMGTK